MPLAVKSLILLAACLAALWGWTQHRARSHEARAEAAFPPEGQIITVQGHPVHAVVMGEGPDLVLIHGASGNTRDLTFDLAPRLAQDYRVIVLDRPGLGYTPRINRTGATITQQAALLQEAAAQLGADKPIVLGHSYGGAVALAWAVTQPNHIAALVNIAGAAEPWDTGLSTYYRVLSHPVLGPLVIPLLTAFVPDSRVEQAVQEIFAPQEPPANALQRANLLGEIEALHTRYAEISVPVEIVHGTADTTVGVSIHSEPLAAQVKDAHLTVLDGIGHMPHHSAPEAVVSAINRAATRAGLRPAD